MTRRLVVVFLVLASIGARAGEPIPIRGGACVVLIDPADGSLVEARMAGQAAPMVRGGEHGLWRLEFEDGSSLDAREVSRGGAGRSFDVRHEAGANRAELNFGAPESRVQVVVEGRDEGVEIHATVEPGKGSILALELPARLRFDPSRLERLVSPLTPHDGVGAAFRPSFFREQPRPSGWQPRNVGPGSYARLLRDAVVMRDMAGAPVAVTVTPTGKDWLGDELARGLQGSRVDVSRPSTRSAADVVLLDSPNGPVLSASRLGGTGGLWRWGGFVRQAEVKTAAEAIAALVRHLAAEPGSRAAIGLIQLESGPESGGACAIPVASWKAQLDTVAASARRRVIVIASPGELLAALRGGTTLAIVNPYGEWLPVAVAPNMAETVDAIGRFVREGGNWVETGGYPFYAALVARRYQEYEAAYPPLFADFVHLAGSAGSLAVFRVQPHSWGPWQGLHDPAAILIPGRLAFGGDKEGGWLVRSFATYVAPGTSWRSPVVRLSAGRTARQNLDDYSKANALGRPLREKLPRDVLDRFRHAVLVKYNGSARDQLEGLPLLPVPSLIHFEDYLHGGFDKQYPDHLPPRARYGTPGELRALIDRARELGHLVMPYTNPTWWCDEPRGPTFLKAGEAPLARGLDGRPYHERYGPRSVGWTTTPWHPAVRAANRELRRQFAEDYPVDILFQDQVGARTWVYDRNPASPTPYAYAEGLLSQADEDARVRPLATEDGYDRVLNAEVQLCGFTFALVPGLNPSWARSFKSRYPATTWEIFPVAQVLAHEKAAMLHHDLGKFVSDRVTLSWTLGLGFAMSEQVPARALHEPRRLEWLRWLARIQQSISARYVGEPVRAFEHEPGRADADDGLIRATYGPVRLVANLGADPRPSGSHLLAGFGFQASASGLMAGDLGRLAGHDFGPEGASFVVEGTARDAQLWVWGSPGGEAGAVLPEGMEGRVELTLDGAAPQVLAVQAGAVWFTLPRSPWRAAPTLAGLAVRHAHIRAIPG
ncbi:MAG: hypothetical protein ACLQBX_09705 [Candidatus Limnocylindrales bacterium]